MNATFALIVICFLAFGASILVVSNGISGDYLLNEFGFSGINAFAKPWTFLTCAFIHFDIAHLLSNMFVLLFFGASLEGELGRGRMLLVFFLGVLAGDLISLFFYAPSVILIGASAGIFALIGAGMLIKPLDMSFYPFTVPMPLGVIGILYIIYNSLGLFAGEQGISYIAHAGGMIVGLAFGFRHEGFRKSMLTMMILCLAALLLPVLLYFILRLLS